MNKSSSINSFLETYQEIVIKPLYGKGGEGIIRVRADSDYILKVIKEFLFTEKEPIMIQPFLPEVTKGDKRIILLDGEILGAINRIPQKGEIRSNMHVGGKAVATELSIDEIKICEQIGSTLKEHGQIFVGIDVIGGKLTEINVTSPTGLQELEKFENKNLASIVWDKLISKI